MENSIHMPHLSQIPYAMLSCFAIHALYVYEEVLYVVNIHWPTQRRTRQIKPSPQLALRFDLVAKVGPVCCGYVDMTVLPL